MKVEPVELHGKLVRLEPLADVHVSDLYESSRDPALWTYKPVEAPWSVAQMTQLVAGTLADQRAGMIASE